MHKLMLSFVSLCCLGGLAFAGSRLPANSKPLVDILKAVEQGGYTDVTEISFDDGVWEVEALKSGHPVEVTVSPTTGELLSARSDESHRKLPANAKPLPEILRQLEAAGYTSISSVDLERSGWDVDCYRDGVERELLVDAVTGKVLVDELDD